MLSIVYFILRTRKRVSCWLKKFQLHEPNVIWSVSEMMEGKFPARRNLTNFEPNIIWSVSEMMEGKFAAP